MDNFDNDNNFDEDEDDDYYDEDEDEEEEEPEPQPIGNQPNNQNNMNNNQNNQQNVQNVFGGYNFNKNGCAECLYCGKYFGNEYIIDGTCGHCWGFCFCSNFDLEKFTYNGPQPFETIKNYLKLTHNFHPKSCNSMDCIYFKINKFNTDKKLSRELGEYLGIMEPLVIKKEDNSKTNGITTYTKKRNVKINFKLSSISI